MPFYREDRVAILRPFRDMPNFAREQRLDYLFFTAADFHRDLPEPERAEVRLILSHEPEMVRVYDRELSAIYRLQPPGAGSPPLLTLASPPRRNRARLRAIRTRSVGKRLHPDSCRRARS